MEVLADTVLEDGGFTDVDNFAGGVLMEIDPGGGRESFKLGGKGRAKIRHIIYIIA